MSEIKTYKEVVIGSQVWMAENLNVDKFRNGDPIPEARTAEEWERAGENKQPAWCYYDNAPANGAKYGKLYNWYAVNDPRGLAPYGWYVPEKCDWEKLINFLDPRHDKDFIDNYSGIRLKSFQDWPVFDDWHNKLLRHSNESGFNGLPGGRIGMTGYFQDGFEYGYWWCSTDLDAENANTFILSQWNDVRQDVVEKTYGLSVRVIKMLKHEEVYSTFEEYHPFGKDIKIGNQIWMRTNLNVSQFRNGDTIQEASSIEEWIYACMNKQPAYCLVDEGLTDNVIMSHRALNTDEYGKLYNWYAVSDPRGLAPEGWHIPSELEWERLIGSLGGAYNASLQLRSTYGWPGFTDFIGRKSGIGNNFSGFNALPSGARYEDGSYSENSEDAHWWSSSVNSESEIICFNINYSFDTIRSFKSNGRDGFSVRCLRDYPDESLFYRNYADRDIQNLHAETKIGSQIWMTKNLDSDQFCNGEIIPEAKSAFEWLIAASEQKPAYCYYKYNRKNGFIFGKLYNWYAIIDRRGLAPPGWHIPSKMEWQQLNEVLDKYEEGIKLKSENDWSAKANGTNSSNFSALPGGYHNCYGEASQFGLNAVWWSIDSYEKDAYYFSLFDYYPTSFIGHFNKGSGFSVRLVKDY